MTKTPEAYNKLKEFTTTQKYISLKQINSYFAELGYSYSNETIKKYLQKLKREEVIFSAGHGYYSTIKNTFDVDLKESSKLIKLIKKQYPLLEFSLWSTKMLAGLFHHTQNQFYTFLYADSDYLIVLRDFLIDYDQDVLLNPAKSDIDKNIIAISNQIVLRPSITRSKSIENIAVIEKIMVDLYLESERLNLFDLSDYNKLFDEIISTFRINISSLIDYAERRKIDQIIKELIMKYTNATLLN